MDCCFLVGGRGCGLDGGFGERKGEEGEEW